MVYSAALAQRFGLPESGIEPLDPGVGAIVLRIVQRAPSDEPKCDLDIYLDDSLDLAYPTGSEGVMVRPDDENPLFFASGDLAPEEHRWDAMFGNYHSVACITTRKKECMTNGGGPNASYAT
jgi:hypothetical protein